VKFLCDNCKAKYQIADEKVAGKTVRMKCRKCGHQIEVRAAVTETSVASAPPRPPTNSATPPRAPQKSGLATSLSAAKPRAPSPSVSPPRGALAGAFKSNVQDAPASVPGEPAAAASIELSVTDEWYVAINGVPVGPVRISELRRKAAGGAVTEESLCWQEGLEEWRPIRSIPDLAALVREAAQGNRPSLIGTAPEAPSPPPRSPSPPAAPRAPSAPAPRRNTPPPTPRPIVPMATSAAPPATRSNVVPLRPAASSNLEDMPLSAIAPIGGAGAAAALAPSLAPPAPIVSTPPEPASPLAPVADPFATAPAPAVPAPAAGAPAPVRDPGSSIVPPPAYAGDRKGVPLWFWPILVLALGFGGGIAFIAFRPQPAPAPVVIQMPTPAATTPATVDKGEVPPPTNSAEPATAASSEAKGKTGPIAVKAPTPTPKPPETAEKKGLDLGNLVASGGGPNVGPNSSPGAGAGGGLDQAGVERVVAVHRTGVKRTCWERGGADQKSSVNVTITANVAPNGSVSSTSSSGDDPVVAKCIESQVKTWQFPAPGSSTTINIPFKFVRQ
jgi:predicted Zn finger-like uncharacterized protein